MNRRVGRAENNVQNIRRIEDVARDDFTERDAGDLSDDSVEGSSHSQNDADDEIEWEDVAVDDLPADHNIEEGMPDFYPIGGHCGPTILVDQRLPPPDEYGQSNTRILDYFSLFFTATTIDQFVRASNNHAVLRRVKNWNPEKPIDAAEFKAFLAAIIFQGLYTAPSRKKAWSLGPRGNKYLRSIMTRQRFEIILDAWSFEDYSIYPNPQFIDVLKAADPFWAVRSFCNGMSTRFGVSLSMYHY